MGLDNVVDSHPPRPLHTDERYKEMTSQNLFQYKGSCISWDDSKISQLVDQNDHGLYIVVTSLEVENQIKSLGTIIKLVSTRFDQAIGSLLMILQ